MKAAIIAVAMMLLAMTSTSHSLPLASPEESAQAVIPLAEKPLSKDIPASEIPAAKSDLKPEESASAAAAEPETKIEESKPAEPELKSIEEKASVVPSAIEEPKPVDAVVATESAGAKEEQPTLIARSAEPEVAPKLDQPAPAVLAVNEAEKHAAEAEAPKGLISPIPEEATDEIVQPVEQEAAGVIVGKDLPTELKSENIAIEKKEAAEIPAADIKEAEKTIVEAQDSTKKIEEVIEAVEKIELKKSEEVPAVDSAKAAEVSDAVLPNQSLERNAGSEAAPEETQEEKVKEVEEEEKKQEEAEEEKKEVLEEPKKESALEEASKPIKAEELPTAEKLKDQPKKPEVNQSSEESVEDSSSQENKDREQPNKKPDDSSSEESDEKPKTS